MERRDADAELAAKLGDGQLGLGLSLDLPAPPVEPRLVVHVRSHPSHRGFSRYRVKCGPGARLPRAPRMVRPNAYAAFRFLVIRRGILPLTGARGYSVYMRILVAGDRNWVCRDLAKSVIERLIARYGRDLVIVHGAATGVDTAFSDAARDAGLNVEPHEVTGVDWNYYGERAGPLRNAKMVQLGADLCIAVHRNLRASHGTKDCATRAIAAGIPTFIVGSDDGAPVRLDANDSRLAQRRHGR